MTATPQHRVRPAREEQAWQEIGQTAFAPGLAQTLVAVFLAVIICLPVAHHLHGRKTATELTGPTLRGKIVAVSAGPERGAVYNDFVRKLHVTGPDLNAVVAVMAMRDREILPAAHLRVGDEITFTWQPWAEVAGTVGSLRAAELPDLATLELPVLWATAFTKRPAGFFAGLSGNWRSVNRQLAQRINAYETRLDDEFWLAKALRPGVQTLLVRAGAGNEKAYVGRDGWLFYEPDVKYVTGPGFLEPGQLRRRFRDADVQPDPRPAILHFRDQLAARGIELIVMPTPVKPTIHPEQLWRSATRPVRNRSFDAFVAELRAAGVRVFDPAPVLLSRDGAQYLATDTHWTPQAMQAVAEALALEIGGTRSVASVADPAATTERGPPFSVTTTNITQLGDIGKMLELPAGQTVIQPETVTIERVTLPAASEADVLLLGDSFANIYSLAGMGWGDDAGLAEQLCRALGRPVDRIIRNDAGSHATRELLRDEPGRLTGKRKVVWQFAERELAFGDWKQIELPVESALPAAPTDDVLARLGRLGVESLARDQMAVVGKDEWLFLSAELRHLGAGEFWGESAARASQASRDPDPLPAIVDLHRQLSAMGIKLLLVPVPPRAVIYPDKLLADVPVGAARIDRHHQKFYELLRRQGVTVVDVTDDFRAARATDATHGPVCCEQDTHWSPRGIEIAVERIAQALDEWPAEPKVETYRLPPETMEITGDLVKRAEKFELSRQMPVTLARVSAAPDRFVRVEPDEESPIILLTDSHGLVFHDGGDMHTEGAGVADLLAARLGVGLDLMARRGSGSEIRIELARRFLGDPTLATRKKVVIYLFAARFFTESEMWRPVPLRRANP